MHIRLPHAVLVAIAGMLFSGLPAAAATPDTKITSGPSGLIASRSATFRFKATVSGATFQCKIDAKDWTSCDSPKKYKKLKQGDHTFQVRARKRHAVDRTPATRSFTVDTVAPETTVYGPQDNLVPYMNGYTEDQTPSSTFVSSEPGTFKCRITSASSSPPFVPCESTYTPSSSLPRDAFYTVEAKAIDEAGNVDPTPGFWDFDVETPITEDQQTAELAAAIYFPDAAAMDVPASCGGTNPVDCPNGSPLPADDDQLSTASSRNVVWAGANSHRYDVTATHDAQTLSPIVLTTSSAGDCNLTLNSANGTGAHWTISDSLVFVTEEQGHTFPGGRFISPQNFSVGGFETADFALGGSTLCDAANAQRAFFTSSLAAEYPYMLGIDRPLCPKPGPGYIAPCPQS
jgi:hypothetical protein